MGISITPQALLLLNLMLDNAISAVVHNFYKDYVHLTEEELELATKLERERSKRLKADYQIMRGGQ
jgi:hypothetical protein